MEEGDAVGELEDLRHVVAHDDRQAALAKIGGAEDQVAYAGHADGLKATLSVRENLTFWARIFGQTDISHALSAFDLTALETRPAGTLSAGQKRRLGLARLALFGLAHFDFLGPRQGLLASSC